MKQESYSQRQRDIKSGKISVEELSLRALTNLMNTAISIGDQQMADLIEPILSQKKEESRLRRNQRSSEYYHSVVKPFRDAHPDIKYQLRPVVAQSTEYTEYQKKIIRGEAPYENVRTADLVRIAAVARANSNFELANAMDDLANEKHADAVERNRVRTREGYYAKRGLDPNDSANHRKDFRRWERSIIESISDPYDYTISALEEILKVAKRAGDETASRVMEFLLAERMDRSVVYIAKTKEEAFAIIESNAAFPIRSPDDWFSNEQSPFAPQAV